MLMDRTSYKMVENLTKTADQLLRYEVFLVLEKAASPPSTTVSYNRALNAIFCTMLTRLMR